MYDKELSVCLYLDQLLIQERCWSFVIIKCVCLFLPRFLSDYDEQFPIADDISLLQQALPLM